jgi:hypothetical protein
LKQGTALLFLLQWKQYFQNENKQKNVSYPDYSGVKTLPRYSREQQFARIHIGGYNSSQTTELEFLNKMPNPGILESRDLR